MSNKTKTTILAYMMFLFIGVLFLIPASSKLEIARDFSKDTADIQYIITFYTLGSFIAIIINKFLLEKIKLKTILNACFTISLLSIFMIKFIKSYSIFGVSLFLLGLSAGIIVSMSNYFIISIYKEKRTKVLNMLNFCYSFGSLISPLIVVYLLRLRFKWDDVYFLMIIFIIFFIIFTNIINFDKSGIESEKKSEKPEKSKSDWNFMVVLVGVMLFLYVLAEMSVTFWLDEYSTVKGIDASLSKMNLSLFWIFIAVGRVLAGSFTFKIRDSILILIFSFIAILGYIGLISFGGIMFSVSVCIVGIGCSLIYATLLSYGTNLQKNTSTAIMTFYILSGNFGSVATSPITGTIKKLLNVNSVFIFAIGMMGLLFILLVIVENIRMKNLGLKKE